MNSLAIVTGGSRGIGKAITETLIKNGFEVYFTYKKDANSARQLEKSYPGLCQGFCVDGSDLNEVEKFASTILNDRGKTIEVLVNNSGVNDDKLFINQDVDHFWETMKSNFGSVLNFCKCFVEPMMRRRNGQIINITSVAAIKPKIGNAAYGVSKNAVERFSKTLALEVARFNIRINCVSPAYVDTDLLRSFLNKNSRSKFYSEIPMRKVLDVSEVSSTVKALCLGEIRTTGSILYIGNGENISM